MKFNLGINVEPQLETCKVLEVKQLLKEFKDVFAWKYKYLKWISLNLAQHRIDLNSTIALAHQAKYRLNPNYTTTVKQNIDKLLIVGFIQSIEEGTWLSPIIIIPKKNVKLKIYINFRKLNVATKKDPYPLPFTNEVLNTIAGYEINSFLDGYSGYHQISITPKDKYKTTFVIDLGAFIWKVMSFGV